MEKVPNVLLFLFCLTCLTIWLCFIVYFAFMCVKHPMIWFQLKDLTWPSPWCVSQLERSFPTEFICGTICFIHMAMWYFEFSHLLCHLCNVRSLFALLISASEILGHWGRCFAFFDATLARLSAVSFSGSYTFVCFR